MRRSTDLIERMQQFYLSRKTFLVSLIGALILMPVGMIMQAFIDDLIPYEWIAFFVLYCLLIGLFITHRKQDYILMNGIVSGILIYEFVRYVYLITYLTSDYALSFSYSKGLLGCFFLSSAFLCIAVVFLITYNHFTINRSHAVNRTKIIFNQFMLFFSFFMPFFFATASSMLGLSINVAVAYGVSYLADALVLLVVACCELELALNRKDETTTEDLVTSDIKASLWYLCSLLFALLCLNMALILPDTRVFAFILSFIDVLLSFGLLIYYLNRNKEPSPRLRTYLHVGLMMTIGLMVFFIGYFIWIVLS